LKRYDIPKKELIYMTEKITVIAASPRKGGNSEMLADAFIGGAKKSGHEVTKFNLYNRKISPCFDCKVCYKSGICVFDDGMTDIYETLVETDVLVIATPVYFYGFPAQLKCLIDRLHNPVRERFAVKKAVLLSVCADRGIETFRPLTATFDACLRYLHWENGGMVLADGIEEKGAIAGSPKLLEAELLGLKGI
jgi:multimeric flavodoxin WrbA